MIVLTHAESGPVTIRSEAAGDRAPDSIDLLINQRFSLPLFRPSSRRYDKRSRGCLHFEPLRAVEVERDLAGVRSRFDHEVVFQLPAFAVVNKIDPGIDL